jgi:hypothetical protein
MALASRTISPSEVRQWVGADSEAKLSASQYKTIATCLTKFRWHKDPPANAPSLPKIINEPDESWWDFQAATRVAKTLRECIPKILAFQDGLRWAPETRDGHPAIEALRAALDGALPYIEWPFGKYEPAIGYKYPKKWHTYATLVARLLVTEMIAAGNSKPGISRNSVVVRVVQRALQRMEIPQSKTLTPSAIGQHLTRWDTKYGLIPKGNAAMTTK